MSLTTATRTAPRATASENPARAVAAIAAACPYVDPLDPDEPADKVVVTTRRAISRVALVASETAGRFQREGVAHDPMTWMMAPRVLFGGVPALDACLRRDACMRGILVHGLSLGLDADPAEIDALLDEDVEDGGWTRAPGEPRSPNSVQPEPEPPRGGHRLFTATIVGHDGMGTVQAFHASLATEAAEVASRLHSRIGDAVADAVIVEGFDPTAPLVAALVAPALCDTLTQVAADPGSPLAAGLDLNVEQRFLT